MTRGERNRKKGNETIGVKNQAAVSKRASVQRVVSEPQYISPIHHMATGAAAGITVMEEEGIGQGR